MIELRDCIVGVKDVKEYEKVIQIAKEQGCEWNSGDSLDYIYCPFPGTLFFDKKGKVTSGPYYEKYCGQKLRIRAIQKFDDIYYYLNTADTWTFTSEMFEKGDLSMLITRRQECIK